MSVGKVTGFTIPPCEKYIYRNIDYCDTETVEAFQRQFALTLSQQEVEYSIIAGQYMVFANSARSNIKGENPCNLSFYKGEFITEDLIDELLNDETYTYLSCSKYYRKVCGNESVCIVCPYSNSYKNQNAHREECLLGYMFKNFENMEDVLSLMENRIDVKEDPNVFSFFVSYTDAKEPIANKFPVMIPGYACLYKAGATIGTDFFKKGYNTNTALAEVIYNWLTWTYSGLSPQYFTLKNCALFLGFLIEHCRNVYAASGLSADDIHEIIQTIPIRASEGGFENVKPATVITDSALEEKDSTQLMLPFSDERPPFPSTSVVIPSATDVKKQEKRNASEKPKSARKRKTASVEGQLNILDIISETATAPFPSVDTGSEKNAEIMLDEDALTSSVSDAEPNSDAFSGSGSDTEICTVLSDIPFREDEGRDDKDEEYSRLIEPSPFFELEIKGNECSAFFLFLRDADARRDFISLVEKESLLCIEATTTGDGSDVFLIYLPAAGSYYCMELNDEDALNSIRDVLSRLSVPIICYQPFFLYGFCRRYSLQVRGVFSIWGYLYCKTENYSHSLFKAMESMTSYSPNRGSFISEFVDVFSYYKDVYISYLENRTDAFESELRADMLLYECFGSNFLLSDICKTDDYLLLFEDGDVSIRDTVCEIESSEGYILEAGISDSTDDNFLFAESLLRTLTEKGSFRQQHELYFLALKDDRVVFWAQNEQIKTKFLSYVMGYMHDMVETDVFENYPIKAFTNICPVSEYEDFGEVNND